MKKAPGEPEARWSTVTAAQSLTQPRADSARSSCLFAIRRFAACDVTESFRQNLAFRSTLT